MEIKASNLTREYNGRKVVSNINIELRPGQILGLLGPNGAGKTTTIKMLSGQIKPSSGNITIDGEDYSSVPTTLRGKIGVVPQDIIIWDELTVEENLQYSGKLLGLDSKLLTAQVEKMIFTLNLGNERKTIAKNLSGGFKRRLNLAISIIHEPTVIFIDEPTPGIDPQNRKFLWAFIKSLRDENRSIVLTDHYLDEAEQLSDYIVIIDEGKIVTEGTMKDLRKKHGAGTLVEIELENADTPESKALNVMLKKEFNQVTQADRQIVYPLDDLNSEMPKTIKILEASEAKYVNLSVKESNLEDIFLLLTGKTVRE